jgi:HSP20 family protein
MALQALIDQHPGPIDGTWHSDCKWLQPSVAGPLTQTNATPLTTSMKLTQCPPSSYSPSGLDALLRHPFAGLVDLGTFLDRRAGVRHLVADISEEADHYDARFEVPGVKKDDVKIDLNDRLLTVTVVKRDKSGDAALSQTLSRSVSVPDSIAADKIGAKLEDGVLTVTLPKQESRKPRAIEIN